VWQGIEMPIIGRISMDLVIVDATTVAGLSEGSLVVVDFKLASTAAASGMSQYELLTGIGNRSQRLWA
jgi:alanine racemase